jgi:hypothetical protein
MARPHRRRAGGGKPVAHDVREEAQREVIAGDDFVFWRKKAFCINLGMPVWTGREQRGRAKSRLLLLLIEMLWRLCQSNHVAVDVVCTVSSCHPASAPRLASSCSHP